MPSICLLLHTLPRSFGSNCPKNCLRLQFVPILPLLIANGVPNQNSYAKFLIRNGISPISRKRAPCDGNRNFPKTGNAPQPGRNDLLLFQRLEMPFRIWAGKSDNSRCGTSVQPARTGTRCNLRSRCSRTIESWQIPSPRHPVHLRPILLTMPAPRPKGSFFAAMAALPTRLARLLLRLISSGRRKVRS